MGIKAYLHYPIAHYRAAESLLRAEASRRPEYSETLQAHDLPPFIKKRLSQEIASADRIFVLSSYQKRTFVEEGVDERKLLVTPLGVDTSLFRPLAPKERAKFRVLFVGQITQRKGLSYLIEGFQKAAIADSELLLIGRVVGNGRSWGGFPHIAHVSHVPRWQLPALYSSADVFILPSLVEGFGLTALEAMACGLPVIVSENTFGKDIISDGRTGHVVPIRDSDAIADRLRGLHAQPALRKGIGMAARARALDFSWKCYGDNLAQTIKNG